MDGKREARVLIYSHDTFGLGHLRRCRAIAHALVGQNRNLSVLILSGSPIIGNFDFRARVDFVRVPGVIKLRNGEYTSLALHIDVEKTLAIRSSIVQHTAEAFDPDLFIVDKEPLGLRGEVGETLAMLKKRGTPLVLGLRDVLDDPEALGREWRRKNVLPALRDLYDEIWIYGVPEMCDPLAGAGLSRAIRDKVRYTGYLRRGLPAEMPAWSPPDKIDAPYILVTTGGGGDGQEMIDWVLSAYEADAGLPHPALIVLGPFMATEIQAGFLERCAALPRVEAITFDAHMEGLMARSVGVVAMGGYNTFCEILSFDKPALIVPRTVPRLEQFIRASRAQELGLVRMLGDDGTREPLEMARALRELGNQPRPSLAMAPGLLDGLESMNRLADRLLRGRPAAMAAGGSGGATAAGAV
ncbi:MAG: glycosyltransferase [Alphaproteobacteria bacterium]